MSKKYQKSMDKIVMSDALKNKIMRAAAEKSEQSLKKPKRMPAWYFRTAAGCAASIMPFGGAGGEKPGAYR